MQEQIQGLRRSVAQASQHLQAPKTWQGSESVNVLQVLCDLLVLVKLMSVEIASHTHGASPAANNSELFTLASGEAKVFGDSMKAITE